MSPSWAKRIDANQNDVVKGLRKVGASVCILSSMGKGVPDLLVGYQCKNFAIELKDGDKTELEQQLTEDEKKWHLSWKGQVSVCNALLECYYLIGVLKK